MAIRATGGFNLLRYEPGNPEFPTLPDGVIVPHFIALDRVAGFRAPTTPRRRKFSNAPARDDQRFAGWHTDTTWVNPSIIDFGVIPSPVQRTVSLYNARFTPVEVTALSLPVGVAIVGSPTLPVTLDPYSGVTFTLEASTTGANQFDEFHTFTTSEGDVTVRILGRRVFTLAVTPEAPITETLMWKTDVLRSSDGTEKAYSLMRTPNSIVDYKLNFTNDLDRIRFHNDYLAGSSSLVVAAEKWYEKRPLKFAVDSADLVVSVDSSPLNASFAVDGSLAVVSPDGVSTNAKITAINTAPDTFIDNVVVIARWDGADGSTSATNLIDGEAFEFRNGSEIDTAQSKFGGSSLLPNTTPVGFTLGGCRLLGKAAFDYTTDWTQSMWFRPTAGDISGAECLASRWNAGGNPRNDGFSAASWRIHLRSDGQGITYYQRQGASSPAYQFAATGSPNIVQPDEWHYLRLSCVAGQLYVFINGTQVGTELPVGIHNTTDTPSIVIGDYEDSGFTAPFRGNIDDYRLTVGVGRSDSDFTPPTAQHPLADELYTEISLETQLGVNKPLGSWVVPLGLGYTSKFPRYNTYPENLEQAEYSITMNREPDWAELPASVPTLSDGLSPETLIPILERCNALEGRAKQAQLDRKEWVLDSGLSNRAAFNALDYGSISSSYKIYLESEAELWEWRQFMHYIAGSYRVFYVPTFKDDIPGVTTLAGNTFTANDTNLFLLFGGSVPDNPRRALRLEYPDGTIQYRRITAVVDNGATEDITVDSPINAGSPKISYMRESRILGDTVTFKHNWDGDVELTFRYRTILK